MGNCTFSWSYVNLRIVPFDSFSYFISKLRNFLIPLCWSVGSWIMVGVPLSIQEVSFCAFLSSLVFFSMNYSLIDLSSVPGPRTQLKETARLSLVSSFCLSALKLYPTRNLESSKGSTYLSLLSQGSFFCLAWCLLYENHRFIYLVCHFSLF